MTNKIKILYIINNLTLGGAETLLYQICNGLYRKENGYEIKVVLQDDFQDLSPLFRNLGIEIVCLNVRYKGFITRIMRLYKTIYHFKPDIVHTHLLSSDGPGQIAAFFSGIKIRISTQHSLQKDTSRKQRIIRFITSIFATNIITVSYSAQAYYLDNKIFPSKKIHTIYNSPGFNTKRNTVKKINVKAPTIKLINIGRLFAMKGHIYLINAMKELDKNKKPIELEIFGDGPEKEALLQEIEQLHINNVYLRGVTNNVKSALENADIFLAASLWEGFHMAVVEAMSVGLPVIVTDIPSHRELLRDIDNYPFFVKPKDSKSLAEAVISLVNSPDLYTELSQKCLTQSKKFSINTMIKNYDSFYNSLMINTFGK